MKKTAIEPKQPPKEMKKGKENKTGEAVELQVTTAAIRYKQG